MNCTRFLFPSLVAVILISCSVQRDNYGHVAKGDTPISKAEATHTLCSNDKNIPFWGGLFTAISDVNSSENICISPLSAQMALSMTAAGATGETKEEIYGALQQSGNVNAKCKDIIDNIGNDECEVSIANSIWINEKLNVKEDFVKESKKYFNAQVTTAPFNKATLKNINDWCSTMTNGKIKSILDEIKKSDRMYLINALYFKGAWTTAFDKSNTVQKPFTTVNGNVVEVDMMHQTKKTIYYEDSVLQMASMPFRHKYRMLLILPAEGVSISEAATHLATNYSKCLDNMSRYSVELSLPRFRSEFKTSLKNTLREMGIEKAFSASSRFDSISDYPLYIDNIVQKTYISIDEEGAEAAAVTGISMALTGLPRPLEKRVLNLNRPFLYMITDYTKENVLFIGKVGDPKE